MNDAFEATIRSVLDEAFPGRAVDEIRSAGVSFNPQNGSVLVEFADGDSVYLKVAVDGDGSRIAREVAVIDYVGAHCDVAVPSVVASDPDAETPYLATAPMPQRNVAEGWSDRSRDEQARIVREIGAALAEIHSRTFERHGRIVGGEAAELAVEWGTWTDVLVEYVRSLRTWPSSDLFDRYFDEVVSAIEANRDRLDDAPATLAHGDPAHPNIFRGDATIGFIDWELAHVGDPARELHRANEQLLHNDTGQLVTALHDGYADRAGSLPDGLEDRAPVYEAVWHLSTLSVFDKQVERSDESHEAAAADARAEMERYLDAIR